MGSSARKETANKSREQAKAHKETATADVAKGNFLSSAGILELQRAAGNAAVAGVLRSVIESQSAGQPSVSRFTDVMGQQGSGGKFDWDVEAHLQYPAQTNVEIMKFGKDTPEQPFQQQLQPEQDPQFASRGSGRGAVLWNINTRWDFGARLAAASTVGALGAGIPNVAGAPETALGLGQDASGNAHVTVVAPFNVQHAAFDKPLSGSDRQRANAEQQSQTPGGPTRADRNKITVQWGQPRTTEMSSDGKGASLTGTGTATDVSDDGGSVTVTPQLQMQSQSAAAGQGSTTGGVSFIGTAQTQLSEQFQQQMSDTQSMSRSFTADVKVPPAASLAPKMQFEGESATVGPFGVDSDKLPGGMEDNISAWYLGESAFNGPDGVMPAISSGAREMIEAGQVEMRVTGHASATGSSAHNRELSRRRAEKVTNILKDLAGSDIKINQRALGRAKTRTKPGQPREDPKERRVQIEYQADVSQDADTAHSQNASDVENG